MESARVSVELVDYDEQHLRGILELYEAESWPSFPQDPALAERACTGKGVVSVVALQTARVVGFARLLTDGALDAYLCELVVAETARRQGVGRALVKEAFARSGARRLDLLAGRGSEAFYRSFEHRAFPGYRIYPEQAPAIGVPQAPLRETRHGLAPDGEGWFVVDARDVRWRDWGPLGMNCDFEGKRPFPQLGVNLNRLLPGQPMGLYHRERHQEGFLVLAGECLLLVEGDERRLAAWDFFHCPGGTAHIIVGAGDGPSLVLAFGGRGGRKGLEYIVDPAALQHGVGVATPTTKPAEAYARLPHPTRVRCGEDWLPAG